MRKIINEFNQCRNRMEELREELIDKFEGLRDHESCRNTGANNIYILNDCKYQEFKVDDNCYDVEYIHPDESNEYLEWTLKFESNDYVLYMFDCMYWFVFDKGNKVENIEEGLNG